MTAILFFIALGMIFSAVPKHSLDRGRSAKDYWMLSGGITIIVAIFTALIAY